MRKDYLAERNKKIYDDYSQKGGSYNTLSKKYDVTPQRIQKVIVDVKNKDLAGFLTNEAPKDDREKFKNKAVEMREAGKLSLAIDMFNKVAEWDKANNNLRGHIDVLGHLKISYKLLSERAKSENKKLSYLRKAAEVTKSALDLSESSNEINEGTKAIQKVHFAQILIDTARASSASEKVLILKQALRVINEALNALPGSVAHKAWALNAKAQIQFFAGNIKEAVTTLNYAETCLFDGYEDEMKHGDQAELKLNVWLSGIHLTRAVIYKETGKYILAKHYANSVLAIKDPTKQLANRKNQAKEMLKALEK